MLSKSQLQIPLVFLGTFGLAILLQCRSGAYSSELGAHSDESAHVVTGLMLYDYTVSGDWAHPMQHAENYYLHYPKVAFGHWPPVFYVVQTAWMVPFGPGKTSTLLLMACLCAILATCVYQVIRLRFGVTLSILAALMFTALPLTNKLTSLVMTEILVASFTFAATLSFARYLTTEKPVRWAVSFALLASLAIMTKGTGLLLALVPPITILLTHKISYVTRLSFWLIALIVGLLCAPFYLLTLEMQRNGMMNESFSLNFVVEGASYYSIHLMKVVGPVIFSLVIIGIFQQVLSPLWRRSPVEPVPASMMALLLATWIFHVLVPCGLEQRHLLPAIPALLFFMAAGVHRVTNFIYQSAEVSTNKRLVVEAVLGLGILVLMSLTNEPYQKKWQGFEQVVLALDVSKNPMNRVVLISSDPEGEGMIVSEVALQDHKRQSRYVLRASKMLAKDRWSGYDYKTRFDSPEAIHNYLRDIPIGALILDTSVTSENGQEHHRQLEQAIEAFSESWHLESQHDLVRNGILYRNAIKVYRPVDLPADGLGTIEIDMDTMLGRKIGAQKTVK